MHKKRQRKGAGWLYGLALVAAPLWLQAEIALPEQAAHSALPEARNLLLDVERLGDQLVAVGAQGAMIVSRSNGESWDVLPKVTDATLTAVAFSADGVGLAVGHDGVILRSERDASAWEVVRFDPLPGEPAVDAMDEESWSNAEAAADEDAWLDAIDEPTNAGSPLMNVAFLADGRALAIGAYGLLLESADSGKTWQPFAGDIDNPDGWHYYGIAVHANEVMIVGEKGTVYFSSDHARHFKTLPAPYAGTFFGVTYNDGAWVLFGLQGRLFVGNASGAGGFAEVPTGVNAGLASATVLDGAVVVVGSNGVVLRVQQQPGDVAATLGVVPSRVAASAVLPLGDTQLLTVGAAGVRSVDIAALMQANSAGQGE